MIFAKEWKLLFLAPDNRAYMHLSLRHGRLFALCMLLLQCVPVQTRISKLVDSRPVGEIAKLDSTIQVEP